MTPFAKRIISSKSIAELGFSGMVKLLPRHVGAIKLDFFVFRYMGLRK